MLRLRLWNSAENAQYDVDLYQNAPVNLKYRYTDVTEINKAVGSYSQTFRIPGTKKNLDFFGGLISPAVVETSSLINGTFSLKQKIRAELSSNTVPLMRGHVQVKAVYRQKKDFYDIELVFFGQAVDLLSEIGGSLMSELTLTALDTTVNYLNILTSWLSIGAAPLDGTLVYGVIDKGRNWGTAPIDTQFGTYEASSIPLWNGTGVNNTLNQCDFTPFVQAKFLVTQILEQAGFSFSSAFMDTTDFENIYVPLHSGGGELGIVSDDVQDNSARVGLATNQTTSSSSYSTLNFVDTVDGGLDPGTNWDNSAYDWTAPTTQYIRVDYYARCNNAYYKLTHKDSSGTLLNTLAQLSASNTVVDATGDVAIQGVIHDLLVNAGDTIQWEFANTGSGTATFIGSNSIAAAEGASIRISAPASEATGFDIDPNLNMPEIKQVDFLAGLQKMFNLVFIPDAVDPKKLTIEPFNDFIASGDEKDWTNKVDFSKDLVIKPTTDIQKAKYRWTHAEGTDFINKAVKDQLNRVYGQKETLDPGNDFATGDLTIKTPFAPYVMSLVPNSQVSIHRAIDGTGVGIKKPKMKLAYWNGLQSGLTGTYKVRKDDGSQASLTTFPYFSSFNARYPEVEDNWLNFGWEIPLIPHQAHPLNGLYYKYWSGYVNELYSSAARILECSMFLTSEDIATFNFNDKIYIEDTYYRILEISGYDATSQAPCRVKLIKVLSSIADCADIPTDVTDEGIITFNGSATDFGNRECCERYGYVFTPDKAGGNSRCRAMGVTIVPTTLPITAG
tara:strand:+ start:99 stop:2453 length:2355 start_codon:yes stop_codon:yes gene_type:complete